jgi:hypothetical protein
MKVYGDHIGEAPCILALGISWNWVVSFTLWLLLPSQYQWRGGCMGLGACSGCGDKGNNLHAPLVLNSSHPDHGLSLYWLNYRSFWFDVLSVLFFRQYIRVPKKNIWRTLVLVIIQILLWTNQQNNINGDVYYENGTVSCNQTAYMQYLCTRKTTFIKFCL